MAVWRVVDGVLRPMELAALPARAWQYGFARRFQPRMIIGRDECNALQPA
jgi:hypothetical protein